MSSFYKKNAIVICLSPTDHEWHKAKIIEIQETTSGRRVYKVHYHGWNSSWDEWIHDDYRLTKGSTNNNICKQILNEKKKQHTDLMMKSKENEVTQSLSECEYKRNGKVEILPLPTEINQHLVDQLELICKEKPLLWIQLPKPKHLTINAICDKFVKYQSNIIQTQNKVNPNEEQKYLKQIIWSITYYFNVFMDINIVFPSEMKQKTNLMKHYEHRNKNKKIDFCDIYGAEHLFRLLYNLPKIYDNIKHMTPTQSSKISQYVTLFNGYLTKNIQNIAVDFDIRNNGNNNGLIINKLT